MKNIDCFQFCEITWPPLDPPTIYSCLHHWIISLILWCSGVTLHFPITCLNDIITCDTNPEQTPGHGFKTISLNPFNQQQDSYFWTGQCKTVYRRFSKEATPKNSSQRQTHSHMLRDWLGINTFLNPPPSLPICLIELRHIVWVWDKVSLVPAAWATTGGEWRSQGLMGNRRCRLTPNSDKHHYCNWLTDSEWLCMSLPPWYQ